MLNQLRRGASSLVAKILMAVLVLSFAVWGIHGAFTGYGEDTIAEVGDTTITLQRFQEEYQRASQGLAQQIGRPLSPEMAAQLGIPQQVLGRLVTDAVIENVAHDLGLGISDTELARQIQADPTFQDKSGAFDRGLMQRLLAQNGFTEADYVAAIRDLALRRQLAEGFVGGITAPKTLIEASDRYANEERTIRAVVLTPAMAPPPADPAEDALKAYFDAHAAEFRAPEYRGFTVVTLDPKTMIDPAAVPEEQVRAAYAAGGNRFGTPEMRRVIQIRFPDEAAAKAAAAAMTGGKPLAEVLKELGMTEADVDLGVVPKSALVDPAVADAAFALDKGGITVVAGRFGPALVEVTEITPAGMQPFEAVEATLRAELAARQGNTAAIHLRGEVEDARAEGGTLAEIAERFKLPLVTVPPVTAEGVARDGTTADVPHADTLIKAVFAADPDTETDPVDFGREGGTQWFDLGEVIPARDQTLDEVRPAVIAAWKGEEEAKALAAMATAVADQLRAGTPIEELAAAHATEVASFGPFKRTATVEGLSSQVIAAAFDGGQGTVGAAPGPNGEQIVFVVEAISTPAFFAESEPSLQLANQLADGLGNALLAEYIADRETLAGVSVNQPVLSRAIGMDRDER